MGQEEEVQESYEEKEEGVEHKYYDHCEEHLEKTAVEVPVQIRSELLRALSSAYELHSLSILHTPHYRHKSPLHQQVHEQAPQRCNQQVVETVPK